jgi:hypothetical protein
MYCHCNINLQQTDLMMNCCGLWAHKCSQMCCAHNRLLYSTFYNRTQKKSIWSTNSVEDQPYLCIHFLPYLQKATTHQKWILTLSSGGLNITQLPHSYSWHCITDVNSNCMIHCVTVCVSDNTPACIELSVLVIIEQDVIKCLFYKIH